MMKFVIVTFLMSVASLAYAGDVERLIKATPGVTRIVFDAPGELSITPGKDERVVVEAEPKVLAKLDISVRGDTLTLRAKGEFRTQMGITYSLTSRTFRSLNLKASGNAAVSKFSGNPMEIVVEGSGNADLSDIRSPSLTVRIPGSGNVKLSGSGDALSARIDGSGDIAASSFAAKTVEARIDGSGNIQVHADQRLDASIDGAGNIEYSGKPKVSRNISGAGSIDPI